jgi:predicted RNase H-like HicB family nuclease
MSASYPVVFETEMSGAVTAYVPDLPLYVGADTMADAERAVRDLLAAYVEERVANDEPLPVSRTAVKVARVKGSARVRVITLVGAGALLGRARTPAKAAASRSNGARGGRPRK